MNYLIKTILSLSLLLGGVVSGTTAATVATKKLETVVFKTDLTCESCKKQIEGSIPFEKGVKEVEVNVAEKLVTITFDPAKTDIETLKAAMGKLGYNAEVYTPAKEPLQEE